jgi:hypothetical protein
MQVFLGEPGMLSHHCAAHVRRPLQSVMHCTSVRFTAMRHCCDARSDRPKVLIFNYKRSLGRGRPRSLVQRGESAFLTSPPCLRALVSANQGN